MVLRLFVTIKFCVWLFIILVHSAVKTDLKRLVRLVLLTADTAHPVTCSLNHAIVTL